MAGKNTVTAMVKLTFTPTDKGEPADDAVGIVNAWFEETQSITVYVENERSDEEMGFDLDVFEVIEADIAG